MAAIAPFGWAPPPYRASRFNRVCSPAVMREQNGHHGSGSFLIRLGWIKRYHLPQNARRIFAGRVQSPNEAVS